MQKNTMLHKIVTNKIMPSKKLTFWRPVSFRDFRKKTA